MCFDEAGALSRSFAPRFKPVAHFIQRAIGARLCATPIGASFA